MSTLSQHESEAGSTLDVRECAIAAQRIVRFILSSTTTYREDRLWPPDYHVFDSNPMSVAYGASGTALALKDVAGDLPEEVAEWLRVRTRDLTNYPPGLYTGLAGIAYVSAELGFIDKGAEILRTAFRSPLIHVDASYFQGVAGCGLVSLKFYNITGDERFLTQAVAVGELLKRTSITAPEGAHWLDSEGEQVKIGIAYGPSGVALFLLWVGYIAGREDLIDLAANALAYDVARGRDQFDDLRWGVDAYDRGTRPYWLFGGAGIGSVALRFYRLLHDPQYLSVAERAARGAFTLFSALPGQLEGLSGIGELFIDMYSATADSHYLGGALSIASTVRVYGIPTEDGGLAFPGRSLNRISTDFGYGAAGIAAFLNRIATVRARHFHDM
jgi:lantibiotic modifying enzyme